MDKSNDVVAFYLGPRAGRCCEWKAARTSQSEGRKTQSRHWSQGQISRENC